MALSSWLDPRSVAIWVKFFTPEEIARVRELAEQFAIDGRAIVGAIWWEFRYNFWRGALSDVVQVPAGKWGLPLGNGVGWGSMHWETALALRAAYPYDNDVQECLNSIAQLTTCLTDKRIAPVLIAAEMNLAATAYETIARVSIRRTPEILAVLYHTGNYEPKAHALADGRKQARAAGTPLPVPEVGSDAMGKFVQSHLEELAPFMTQPWCPKETDLIVPGPVG